ncbi:hypothetical protein H9P43_003207 [Blastocladiella emersonii ATCC 22665]|nr:hypothetical protein H9P43_003207 [Blastocladiella emersonii ATCC 22665]
MLARFNIQSSTWLPLIVGSIIALIGVGAALGLLLWFNGVETRTFQRDFHTQCQLSVRSLETVMQVRLKQYAENVAAFTYSSREVTNDTFINFVKRSSFNPAIVYSVSVMPVITPSQIPLYNSLYTKNFFNNDSSVVADDQVATPLPIIFPEARFSSSIVGMNILSSPPRRRAVLETNRTRMWAITPPVLLVDINQIGMISFLVVRERPVATTLTPFTKWFAAVTLLLKDLFTEALDHTRGVPTRTEAALRIVYPQSQEKVFTYGPTDPADLVVRDRYVLPFHAVNESPWTTECIPSRPYRARFRTIWPWVLLGVVLASFALMAELARRGLKRVIVSQQTLHQLRVQERLLGTLQEYSKAITQAIPDAMVLLDSDGRIIGVNDATMEITGYCMAELNQMHVSALLVVSDDGGQLPPFHLSPASSQSTSSGSGSGSRSTSSTVASVTSSSATSTREGTVRRSDGSTLPVQLSISIVEASEIVDQQQRDSARPWTVSPVVTVHGPAAAHEVMSRHTVANEFAQIVLFHDISDQVEHVRVAAALGRRATEAAQARDRLLGFILGSVANLASDMVTDLSNAEELLEERGHVGELADASEAARHMKAMLDDVAGFAGIAIPPAADALASPRVGGPAQPLELVLRRIIDSALEQRRPTVQAKQLAILNDMQLEGLDAQQSVAAARFLDSDAGTGLRAVIAKTVAVGVATPRDSSLAARHPRSSRSDSSMTRLEVSLSVTISRVAPGCITIRPPSNGGDASAATNGAGSEQYQDLDLSLGSRGARFGNVALTFAALTQMSARMGGSVEQRMPRVNASDGTELKLVVRVPIVVRAERQ